jgi:hypothetical protein
LQTWQFAVKRRPSCRSGKKNLNFPLVYGIAVKGSCQSFGSGSGSVWILTSLVQIRVIEKTVEVRCAIFNLGVKCNNWNPSCGKIRRISEPDFTSMDALLKGL